MATTGTVVYTTPKVGAAVTQLWNSTQCPAFKISKSSGSVPTGHNNWIVTKVKLTISYADYAPGETIALRIGATDSDAKSGTVVASGIKVGANRTLTTQLTGTEQQKRNRWGSLDSYYVAFRGENSSANILTAGQYITFTVYWELTEQKSTFTGSSASQVDTGSSITFYFDPGVGVTSRSFSVSCAGRTSTSVTVSGNTVTFTVPSSWNAYISGSTSNARITMTSVMSGGNETDTKDFTAHVPDTIKPTIESITAIGDTSNPLGVVLQNISSVTCSANATAHDIPSTTLIYQWYFNNVLQGINNPFTLQKILYAGDVVVKLIVTDTRGRSAEASTTISVTGYAAPIVSGESSVWRTRDTAGTDRSDEEGTYCRVNPVYTFSGVGGSNTVTTTFEWKLHTDASYPNTYTPVSPVASGSFDTIGSHRGGETFAIINAYDVRITVTDTVGNSSSVELEIDKAAAFMVWDGTHSAVGFGCYPSASNTVEIDQSWDVVRNGLGAFDELENISDTLSDLTSAIGTYYSNTNSSGTSCSQYSTVTICSISNLPAGTYMAEGSAQWPSNANGYRAARIATSAGNAASEYDGTMQVAGTNTGVLTLNPSLVFKLTSTGTVYLRVYHNASGSLTVKGTLHCVRII